ncbi:MAG: hypothetical protein ROO71_07800 [Balneola sp.]
MFLKHTKHIFFVALLTVTGLFSSLVHYHSEGLECLEHAEEAHIVEYEVYCPVSTLVSDADFIETEEIDAFITFDSKIFYKNDAVLKSFISTKPGRSPPFIA